MTLTHRAAWLIASLLGAIPAHGKDIQKESVEAAAIRGSIVFGTYCVLCHGEDATGSGSAAKLYQPRPANLTISPFPDEYKELIIRKGGVAVGRSKFMPPWGGQLTDKQIKDVVAYLGTLVKKRNFDTNIK